MKRITVALSCLMMALSALAQRPQLPPVPENAIMAGRGTAMGIEGRSHNMAPTFIIYPDAALTKEEAEGLVASLEMEKTLQGNNWSAFVVNPVGAKYEQGISGRDFEAFKALFNSMWAVTNLKVIGIGNGATFVNGTIAANAGAVAGILTIDGKPAKLKGTFDPVPAFVAGKTASKVAANYISFNKAVPAPSEGGYGVYANPDEPLLRTVVAPMKGASLNEIFSAAWDLVLSRNYRFNNYGHTWYEGSRYGEYGVYELEPYMIPSLYGVERRIVTQKRPGSKDWLWYEYFPEGTLDAPAKSVPLMVLLHGNTNDPRTQAETSGFIELASEEHFAVVELEWQGSETQGAMGHDGIESVIYQLLEKYPQLDPSRIYAEGLSAGSITATALGIKKSHLFAAVGGHSGGIFAVGRFCEENGLLDEALQKRGLVEVPYCSVLGTADKVVPFVTPDNYVGNGYLKAWNAYECMNGVAVVSDLDFSVDPLFGFKLSNRRTITTVKGGGIKVETGEVLKGDIPVVKIIAVVDYGHWNFKPTARMMWDFFRQFSRDPQTKRLDYHPAR